MSNVVITAEYILHGSLIELGKFKTEDKAWDALEVELIKQRRLSENPIDTEREIEDTMRVVITQRDYDA